MNRGAKRRAGGGMRRRRVPRHARVLVVGGVDPSGGAGVALDLRVLARLGVHGQVVVSLVTKQSSGRLHAVHPIAPGRIRAQLESLSRDGEPQAVKIGALGSAGAVREVARWLASRTSSCPVVADPVLAPSRGPVFLDARASRAWARWLLPVADLVTPNLEEAWILSGLRIRRPVDPLRAAERLLAGGARAVLVKGGHGRGPRVIDRFVDRGGVRTWSSPRIPGPPVRGTGCALASAIAARLAQGSPLGEAVEASLGMIRRAIREAWVAGPGGARFLGIGSVRSDPPQPPGSPGRSGLWEG